MEGELPPKLANLRLDLPQEGLGNARCGAWASTPLALFRLLPWPAVPVWDHCSPRAHLVGLAHTQWKHQDFSSK